MKREKMENEKKIMVKQLISWKQAQEQAKVFNPIKN